jgi:hypothetical protein
MRFVIILECKWILFKDKMCLGNLMIDKNKSLMANGFRMLLMNSEYLLII